ncbi:MAG: glucanase [Planctomycetota bacterium]|nr:MAG: glucanase [Planctomycetota bacterium]
MSSWIELKELVEIDSPVGYTQKASQYIFEKLESYGFQPEYTKKGAVRCHLGPFPKIALAAHVDTLGAMVSQIHRDGTLGFTTLGGLNLPVFEGEYVRIYTMDSHVYHGTLVLKNPSAHANRNAYTQERNTQNMCIRLDEKVESKVDVENLNIRVGDIIAFDPRYVHLPSGYIKSKFLDNKTGCYVLLQIAKSLREAEKKVGVELFFSNYEEVGHGAAPGFASTVEELIVVDMGVLGTGLSGQETKCSICAKDSSGPYDYELRKELVNLAEENQIPYALDVYPYYGSDGSAALRAGHDIRVALIGPGVAASHGAERTHEQGLEATIALIQAFIQKRIEV